MIGTLQQQSIDLLYEKMKDREEGVQFYLEKITLLDLKKKPYDDILDIVDKDIVEIIDEANNRIIDKQTAYQDRIDSPCRTDLFWRVVGITSDTVETKGGERDRLIYELECTRLSPNGYKDIVIFAPDKPWNRFYGGYIRNTYGLEIVYDDGKTLERITNTGKVSNKTSDRFALEKENFFGAKYYDQPLTRDVFDSFVGEFTGTVSAGSTQIASINTDFIIEDTRIGKVGNLIKCNKSGVIGVGVDATVTIVGFGTVAGSLERNINLITGTGSAQVTASSVYSIDVSDQGGGYTFGTSPNVVIEPPGNVGASATVTINASGSVSSFTVTNSGVGYTVAPDVTVVSPLHVPAVGFGNTGALGAVTGVTTDSAGIGYIQIPSIVFDDPTTYSFNSNSQIDAATNRITLGGGTQPYQNGTQIRYNVGQGNAEGNSFGLTDQTVYFVVNADGTSIQVATTQGGAAINLSTTTASETNFFQGLTATGTVNTLPDGSVGFVTITSGGSGYTDDPAITYGGSGTVTATATAVLSGSEVSSITVNDSGSGYTLSSPPSVIISEPLNVGAAATATVSIGGTIDSINVTNPGAGYTVAPQVTIGAPTDTVLNTYIVDAQAIGNATYPEPDGSEVTFTILRTPEDVQSVAQPLQTNPLSPETIGVMDLTTTGIGTMIELNRSGISSSRRSWRPELISLGKGYEEPSVGADHLYHRIGFNYAPITDPTNSTSYANEGDKLTLTQNTIGFGYNHNPLMPGIYQLEDYVSNLPSCTSSIANALNSAISDASNAVTTVSGKESEVKSKMKFVNAIRKSRDDINIEISSLRGMIGELEREIRELKDALRFSTSNIGITTYNTGNDMNAGINTTPVTTYTVGQIQINAFN